MPALLSSPDSQLATELSASSLPRPLGLCSAHATYDVSLQETPPACANNSAGVNNAAVEDGNLPVSSEQGLKRSLVLDRCATSRVEVERTKLERHDFTSETKFFAGETDRDEVVGSAKG